MKTRNLKSRILALATCTLVLISSLMLPIGAEDATVPAAETPAYTSTIDWSAFPGSNLTIIKEETKTQNGITFTSDINGITVNGTATSTATYFTQSLPLKAEETYCISSNITNENGSGSRTFQLWCRAKNKEIKEIYDIKSGETFSPASDCTIEIAIYVYTGCTINLTIKPMLNKGETAYPYMPYLPYYFEQAFNNGYAEGTDDGYQDGYNVGTDDGYQDGYNVGVDDGYQGGYNDGHNIGTLEGKKEGYDQAVQELEKQAESILDKATFQWAADVYDQPYQKYTFTPNKINSSVNFKNIVEEFSIFIDQNNFDPHLNKCDIILTWNDNDTFDYNTFPLFITGSSLVSSGSLITTDGEAYTLTAANEGEKRQLIAQETEGKILTVKSITIYVGRPQDLLNEFTLFTENESYVKGYNNGYKAGYKENVEFKDFIAYEKGYAQGHIEGKKEGIEINKNGDWRNLLTAVVEAPITAFQGLFSFEILGLNMQAAFGAILALCVLLIIIKKVVL